MPSERKLRTETEPEAEPETEPETKELNLLNDKFGPVEIVVPWVALPGLFARIPKDDDLIAGVDKILEGMGSLDPELPDQ